MSRLERRTTGFAPFVFAALLLSPQPLPARDASPDPVLSGFLDPPHGARPRVWWHWMNGNITEDGIAKDLAWMRRVGIAGMQNFDAALLTPQVVQRRLDYMSPEWKQAFRFTAERARADGLELAIAASPGWSQTGGPWVAPEDAIKKVVWSETLAEGGRRFTGRLAAPPRVTGAFQTMQAEGVLGLAREGGPPPEAYRDIVVLAVPDSATRPTDTGMFRDGRGRALDRAVLTDGDYGHAVDLGTGTPGRPVVLSVEYPQPREVRSATLFLHDARPTFFDHYFTPVLEARVDGQWQRVATFELAPVPTTVAFAMVRASALRVVFGPYLGPRRPDQGSPVSGVIFPDFIKPVPGPHPVKVAEFQLSSDVRVDRFEAKAGFSLVRDYHALPTSAAGDERGVNMDDVIDLSDRLSPDGTLDWTPPPGTWRILRLGWSLTGKTNHPASPEATGLEVDKLDGDAVERYLRHYFGMYRDIVGDELFGEQGVQALMNDSTEVEAFNWTPRMIEHFSAMRGYDPTPWLPTLTGIVVGTRVDADRFLYDFRRTISELHASEHYATLARVAHEHGLKVYGEALEDQRPVLGDDLSMRRHADVPMAAIWVWNDESGPRPTLLGDMKGASSVAHLYGRKVVAAESLTSALAPWADSPTNLRKVIDLAFAHGINLPIIHTSVHQPLDDKAPGLSLMIFGQFFNRHETWAELAKPWVDYLSRSSFLLQQGTNVADVAYFHGEEAPITAITAFGPPRDLPTRYAYDYVNAEALQEVLAVDAKGDLVAASGARYSVLYLGPGAMRMTLPTLRRIAALVEAGATIVGYAPLSSPSLADDPVEFAQLVRRLWKGGGETPVGKGRVIATRAVETALAQLGILPDIEIQQAAVGEEVMFVHRRLADGELYFLVNRSDRRQVLNARFRVFGKAPDILRAEDASVIPASYRQEAAGTTVPLVLEAEESVFVAFRRQADALSLVLETPVATPILDLGTNWQVTFQPGRGAPPTLALDTLAPLSEHTDPGIRHFSGIATYMTQFTLPGSVVTSQPVWLDLGQVGDLAEVRINGQPAGHSWQAPHRIEVASYVRAGNNMLEVKVANRWINRLIGDAQPGVDKIAFVTIPTVAADAPLSPSGLIGPVRLLVPAEGAASRE